jgi:DNA-binding NtrC family response regulator
VAGIAEIERIIADLLEYARNIRLDLGEYPLDRILAPVIAAARAPDERRVRIETHGLEAGIVATVDGPRLRQVFANVLKNAMEASESVASPQVDVRLGLRNDVAVVEIVDNGPGMALEQRDKVFRPHADREEDHGPARRRDRDRQHARARDGRAAHHSAGGIGHAGRGGPGRRLMRRRVLIVEDDEIFLRPLQRSLEVAGYDILVRPSGEDAVEVLKHEDVDCVLTDKRLPGMDGVELVRRLKIEQPDLAIIVMMAHGSIESAVESVRLGAADYLVKPFEVPELLIAIRHAIELQELRTASSTTLRRNQERFRLTNVVTQDAAMMEVFDVLRSMADLDTTVLIHGETGVGKELLARSLHFSGARRDKPFVAVSCAAIPAELFESELFGFRKRAFTSAAESRRGLFQLANGGTLLLDEIGEMPLPLQSKLLRAIEEKRVMPIGSDRAVEIDVRFIATTNKDLKAEAEHGRFRRDLFYRLSVVPIRVPPLRERPGDVPLLVRHFVDISARRSKKSAPVISSAAMQALSRYTWPGNVRELENVIERAVIVAKTDTITDVGRFLTGETERPHVDLSVSFRDARERALEQFERAYLQGVLDAHGGEVAAAARHAGMDLEAFTEKLTRYGLANHER